MKTAIAQLLRQHIEEHGVSPELVARDIAVIANRPAAELQRILERVLDGHEDAEVRFHEADLAGSLRSGLGLSAERYAEILAAPLLFVDDGVDENCLGFIQRQAAQRSARFVLVPWDGESTDPFKITRGRRIAVSNRRLNAPVSAFLDGAGVEVRPLKAVADQIPPRRWMLDGGPDIFGEPVFERAPTHDDDGWPLVARPDLEAERAEDPKVRAQCARYGSALFRIQEVEPDRHYRHTSWNLVDVKRDPKRIADELLRVWQNNTGQTVVWHQQGRLMVAGARVDEFLKHVPAEPPPISMNGYLGKLTGDAFAGTNPLHLPEQWETVRSRCKEEIGVLLPPLGKASDSDVERDPLRAWIEKWRFDSTIRAPWKRKAARPLFDDKQPFALIEELLRREGVLSGKTLHQLRAAQKASVVDLSIEPIDGLVGAWCLDFGGSTMDLAVWRFPKTPPCPLTEPVVAPAWVDGGDILVTHKPATRS